MLRGDLLKLHGIEIALWYQLILNSFLIDANEREFN